MNRRPSPVHCWLIRYRVDLEPNSFSIIEWRKLHYTLQLWFVQLLSKYIWEMLTVKNRDIGSSKDLTVSACSSLSTSGYGNTWVPWSCPLNKLRANDFESLISFSNFFSLFASALRIADVASNLTEAQVD